MVVSLGPASGQVPSLQILGTTDAMQVEIALENLGFAVKQVTQSLPIGDPQINQVLSIEPAPGTALLLGSEVILVVGIGDPDAPSPSPSPTTSIQQGFVTVEPNN